jgi:uncharacterized membrane protein
MTPLAKRLAIAVAISLGLNLLLGGVLVGQALQRRTHRAGIDRGGPTPSGMHQRGPHRPGAFQRTVGARHPEFGERRRMIGAAREKVREALTREPFDKAALEQALAQLRKETEASQAVAHQALVETATSASPGLRDELGRQFQGGKAGKGKRR